MKKKLILKKREENPIHVKLASSEAIEGKKDLLNSEMSILKIYENISNYRKLRVDEINKKRLILKKFYEIKKNLTRIQNLFPTLRIPEILKKEINESSIEEKASIKVPKIKGNIKDQLEEIQEKLKALEGSS